MGGPYHRNIVCFMENEMETAVYGLGLGLSDNGESNGKENGKSDGSRG